MPMADFYNYDYQLTIPNLIKNSVNTLSNSIFIMAGKFFNASRAGFYLERFDPL